MEITLYYLLSVIRIFGVVPEYRLILEVRGIVGKNCTHFKVNFVPIKKNILHELFMMASGENFYSLVPFHFVKVTHFT